MFPVDLNIGRADRTMGRRDRLLNSAMSRRQLSFTLRSDLLHQVAAVSGCGRSRPHFIGSPGSPVS